MEALCQAGNYTNNFLLRQNTHKAVEGGITWAFWYLANSQEARTKEDRQMFIVSFLCFCRYHIRLREEFCAGNKAFTVVVLILQPMHKLHTESAITGTLTALKNAVFWGDAAWLL
jgi:hypothetical protein